MSFKPTRRSIQETRAARWSTPGARDRRKHGDDSPGAGDLLRHRNQHREVGHRTDVRPRPGAAGIYRRIGSDRPHRDPGRAAFRLTNRSAVHVLEIVRRSPGGSRRRRGRRPLDRDRRCSHQRNRRFAASARLELGSAGIASCRCCDDPRWSVTLRPIELLHRSTCSGRIRTRSRCP